MFTDDLNRTTKVGLVDDRSQSSRAKETDKLLLETGSYLLLETGNKLILEN